MNEPQLWYCDICDKASNFRSRSKENNSKSRNFTKEHGCFVKVYEYDRPEKDEVNSILNNTFKA